MSIGDQGMKVEVVCYSGFKGDERPVRFRLGGTDYMVEEVIDQWHGPDSEFFKVRADDGGVCILRRHTGARDGDWSLESHRRGPE